MPMVTRCPACAAQFRVTPQQLQARSGQVRCGRCMTVFDGFAALATTPDLSPPEPQQPVVAQAAPSAAAPSTATIAAPDVAPPPLADTAVPAGTDAIEAGYAPLDHEAAALTIIPLPDADSLGASPPGAATAAPLGDHRQHDMSAPPPPPPAYSRGWPAHSASAISADQSFLAQAHAQPRRHPRVWTLGCLAAALVLAAQAAYVYRIEMAARYPSLRPALAQACAYLGCSVPLPQQPRLINIEASDLQTVDPARPGLIQLTATLRNHAAHDLGYPALDLVLTSTREHTLARRIFLPAEYLERPADADRGLAASAETTVRLVLDTGDLGAAGFRLDLLPAPVR